MTRARRLTARQLEVLEHMTRPGATTASVADELDISVQTVKNHLQVAYRTLGVASLAQATRAIHHQLRTPVP